jgi:hypothetical protein
MENDDLLMESEKKFVIVFTMLLAGLMIDFLL